MEILRQLERLYRAQQLPALAGNPCGACFACCTARPGFQHRISELELAYVAWKVGPEAAEQLGRYASRATKDGELEFPRCPHYQDGCRIYEHRPFSCRVFGHFRERGTTLPEGCSFHGRELEFERGRYYEVVPGARELRPLLREFSLVARAGVEAPAELDPSWLDADDPVDRALAHLARSELEPALAQLLASLEQAPEGSGFVWHTLGLVYGLLERPRLAVDAFRRAVEQLPGHVECLAQLGSSLLLAGDLDEGASVLRQVLEQEPGHSVASGLVGYACLLREDWTGAERHLSRALEGDPGNAFYARRLAEARLRLES